MLTSLLLRPIPTQRVGVDLPFRTEGGKPGERAQLDCSLFLLTYTSSGESGGAGGGADVVLLSMVKRSATLKSPRTVTLGAGGTVQLPVGVGSGIW